MRITHSKGERLVVLSDEEAASVVEACALLVILSLSAPHAALPPRLASVVNDLFVGLNVTYSSCLKTAPEEPISEP